MAIVLGEPGVDGLGEAVGVLREWQYDGAPMQLHPGDQVIGPEQAHVRTAVQRASFDRSTFTDERWHAMAAGSPYADDRLHPKRQWRRRRHLQIGRLPATLRDPGSAPGRLVA